MEKSKWVWMPHAGHFIGGSRCMGKERKEEKHRWWLKRNLSKSNKLTNLFNYYERRKHNLYIYLSYLWRRMGRE